MIDQNRRSGLKKNWGLKLLAGFTRKKASMRRVNRKIADSTRNQRVFFSKYLAANYGYSPYAVPRPSPPSPPPVVLGSYVGYSEVGKFAALHRPPITPCIYRCEQ